MTHLLIVLLVILLALLFSAPLAVLVSGGEWKEVIGLTAQVATVIVAIVAVYGIWPKRANIRVYAWQDARTLVDGSYQAIKSCGPFNVFTIENWSEKDVLIGGIRYSPYGVIVTWMLLSCPAIMNFFWKNGLFFMPHPEAYVVLFRTSDGCFVRDNSWPPTKLMPPMGAVNIYIFWKKQDIPKSVIVFVKGQSKPYIFPIKGWGQTHKTLDEFKAAMCNSKHIIGS